MSNPYRVQKSVLNIIGTDADDYDGAALNWIANGPLCDPLRSFCPAGRLNWRDTKRREAEQWSAA